MGCRDFLRFFRPQAGFAAGRAERTLPDLLRLDASWLVCARQIRLKTRLKTRLMYTELHARSAFSFLEGASLPEELAAVCAGYGMQSMALLDRDGVYGEIGRA